MHRHLFEGLNGHRGGVIWFTGLPGSGKTTLADALQKMLLELGIRCVVMDGIMQGDGPAAFSTSRLYGAVCEVLVGGMYAA